MVADCLRMAQTTQSPPPDPPRGSPEPLPMHRLATSATTGLLGLVGLAAAFPNIVPATQGEAEADTPILIRAERLHVRPGEVREDVSILVRAGEIVEVGEDLAAPDGAEVLESPVVCAGFIDAWADTGLSRSSASDGAATPSTRTVDAVDPYSFDQERRFQLAAGVVAARVQSGQSARIAGVGAVVANDPGAGLDELVLLDEACVSATIQGNDVFERLDAVERLAATIEQGAAYRESQLDYAEQLEEWEKAIAEKVEELEKDFKKAKKDREKEIEEAEEKGKDFKEEKYKEDKRPRAPRFDANNEVMARVASGELPLIVQADRAVVIRALLAKMKTFPRVRWTLAGAADSHFFAEQLAEHRVPVLIVPHWQSRGGDFGADDFELAGQLHEAGVQILFGSAGASPRSRDLSLMAARAVGFGLDADAAFAAITTGPARAFDLGHVTGTVEAGKQAHLLLMSGDPLASTSRVETVILSGDVVYRR